MPPLILFLMKDFFPFIFCSENYFNTLQWSINNDENMEGQGNEKYSTFPEGALESFYFYE